MIYADYNATAPLHPEALKALQPFLSEHFGNPSNRYSLLGKASAAAVEEARQSVAAAVGRPPEQVVFVSGGTEASFQALFGAFLARPERNEFVVSAVGHSAVVEPLKLLEQSFGCRVRVLPWDKQNGLCLSTLQSELNEKTNTVVVMGANNETGIRFDLQRVEQVLAGSAAQLYSDNVQLFARVSPQEYPSQLALQSISAHKIGRPKGIGALVLGPGANWIAPIKGGGQERGLRGGTENVPAIVGFGAACRLAAARLFNGEERRLKALRDRFEQSVREFFPQLEITGQAGLRLANTSHLIFPGINGLRLLESLSARGVIAALGAACNSASGAVEGPTGYGNSDSKCLSALRFSFGYGTTDPEISALCEVLAQTISELIQEGLDEEQPLLEEL